MSGKTPTRRGGAKKPPRRGGAKKPKGDTARLLEIMGRLRARQGGCPWDVEQTFESIAPYTVEEAYEVADAIRGGDMEALRDELGDLLFQVVFHARMAEEAGHFNFDDVVDGAIDKMTRRHPHVFGDGQVADAAAQTEAWERHKADERAARGETGTRESLLDGIIAGLPPMTRAVKLQKRAARVGYDWPTASEIMDKIEEEFAELRKEIADLDKAPGDHGARARAAEELGDLLFVCANLARRLDLDPDTVVAGANSKFVRRFGHMEKALKARGKALEEASLEEMEALWDQAKALEKAK